MQYGLTPKVDIPSKIYVVQKGMLSTEPTWPPRLKDNSDADKLLSSPFPLWASFNYWSLLGKGRELNELSF